MIQTNENNKFQFVISILKEQLSCESVYHCYTSYQFSISR